MPVECAPNQLKRIEYRDIELKDRNSFSELLNLGFGVPLGSQFLDDFPIWDPIVAHPRVRRYGAYQEDRLVSCLGLRMAMLQPDVLPGSPPAPLQKVGLIGAVATRPDARKQGLADTLLSRALHAAESNGALFTLLWGGEATSLYARKGFDLFGRQLRIPLQEWVTTHPRSFPQSPLLPLSCGWIDTLRPFFADRRSGLRLGSEDLRILPRHRNVIWYWNGTPDAPEAFAALGRGIDLPLMIHEWGGKREALHSLLTQISQKVPGAQILGNEQRFNEYQIQLTPNTQIDPLCLLKTIQEESTFDPFWIWGLDAV
jgi:GNAT superfamily N-acetyltransferase